MQERNDLVQVSARLPADAIEWLDGIVVLNRAAHPGRRFTRSDALREAVLYTQACAKMARLEA